MPSLRLTDEQRAVLLAEARAAFLRGWPLTPLRGKVPVLTAWTSQPHPTEATLTAWLADPTITGLGLRTGSVCGLFVADRDTAKGAAELNIPRTPCVLTPTLGEHHYLVAPPHRLGNSASRLAPHWDTRGDGGQVVYPGSLHPAYPQGPQYRWLVRPDETPLAELPAELLALLIDRAPVFIPPAPRGSAYASAALVRESARVRSAREGARNDALNRAAYSLGQLVAGGELTEHNVRAQLEADAILSGLDRREIADTITSGLRGGMEHPRVAPPPRGRTASTKTAHRPATTHDVLIPGSHTLPTGEYVEVSTARFGDSVFDALPDDIIYRRGGLPGEIVGTEFVEVDRHRARILAERHLRFIEGRPPRKADADPTIVFRAISSDHGELIIAAAKSSPRVHELDFLTSFPVLLPDWTVSPPGFSQGVYYCGPHAPDPIRDHATIRSTLEDLVVDFPFTGEADRQNFFGLLLTPLLRVSTGGPVPMHLVHAGTERAGKGKLANDVLGGIILGQSVPTLQLGRSEEEREKRIFAMLLSGRTLHSIDNLDQTVDSAALASLLTANVFQGRVLGRSYTPAISNRLTLVGTGNHISASPEISKRLIPIGLSPGPSPDSRTDFCHPDLPGYVATARPRVYGCLLGMVANWRAAGAPRGTVPLGGFEGWASAVGGVLHHHGYSEWLRNAVVWRGLADEWEPQVEALVAAWARSGAPSAQAKDLLALAKAEGLFPDCTDIEPARAGPTFGKRVLNRLPARPTRQGRIEKVMLGGRATYRLVPY